MSTPPGLDEFLNSPSQAPVAAPEPSGTPAGLDEFIAPEMQQQQYGGAGQQALAGIEGVARGASLGASDLAETHLLGIPQEEIRARKEANPGTSLLGNIAGATGLIYGTGGIAAPAEAAMGGGALATAAAYGGEGALLGAGNVVSDYALGDPNLNAQSIMSQVGMGALAGIGGGLAGAGIKGILGKFGGIKGSVAETLASEASSANKAAQTADAIDSMNGAQALKAAGPEMGINPVGTADDIAANDVAKQTNGITKPLYKENVQDIMAAGKSLGLPVTEGMASANPYIQQAEDSLIQAAPSYSGVKKTLLFKDAYDGLVKHLDEVAPESSLSKAETGSVIQDGLTNKIEQEYGPIKDMYSAISEVTPDIPVSPRSVQAMSKSIANMDEVSGIDSPQADLARRVSKNLLNVENAKDIEMQKGIVRNMANSAIPGEKRMAAILNDKINDWQERAIIKHAGRIRESLAESGADAEKLANFEPQIQKIESLIPQIKEARANYKPFIEDLSYLSDALGKGKIHGPQHGIDFLKNLDFEELTQKLTKKNNSQFREWFSGKYPQEMAVVKQYEKGALRDAASKSGEFSPKVFFNKFNNLEPEIQKSIFAPDELKKIKDAQTYFSAFPKNFNPSGTAKLHAFQDFFTPSKILGHAVANARDFGIDQYIKKMGALPEAVRPNATELGVEMGQKFNQMNAAQTMADRTNQEIKSNVLNIAGLASAAKTPVAESLVSKNDHSYEDKTERIKELAKNPETMTAQISNHVNGMTDHLPNVSQAMATSMATCIGFLNSKIPAQKSDLPLSREWKVSPGQKQKFNRYYDAVNKPVDVMKQIKNGSLSSEAMEALSVCHPDLLKQMRSQLIASVSPDVAKNLNHKTRQALSMFMGTPLSESQLPQVRMANQATFAISNSGPQSGGQKSTQGGLSKLNVAGRMAGQSRR